jgi:PleD family two-component response regulator
MIVLDLVLPDCDGYSVVDWLRRYDRLHSTPLVVYSALDLADIEQERLRLGETMFFTKSRVSQGEFEQRVVGLLDGIVSASANGKGRDEAHTHR